MRIGVIGAGNIGGTLARHLAKLGHHVSIANSRGPESLTALAAEIGATPVSVVDAAKAGEVVIVSIPEKAVAELPRGLFANVPGSVVVVDTGNYYPELRWPHRCDRPGHARQPVGRAAARASRDQGVQQHLRQEPSRERRSEGNDGEDSSLGRRRSVGRQERGASPRRRSRLRPCRRRWSGRLLAAAARNAGLLSGS